MEFCEAAVSFCVKKLLLYTFMDDMLYCKREYMFVFWGREEVRQIEWTAI